MTGGPTRGVAPPATEPFPPTTLKDRDVKLWQRIKTWAIGPGGWLADSDLDAYYARVDQELDELAAARAANREHEYWAEWQTRLEKQRIQDWEANWDAMVDDEEAIKDTEETA